MTVPLLKANNISLTYKSGNRSLIGGFTHQALKDVSFDLMKGETLGILGRNGVGKSTLLRILAGIINPSSGEVVCAPHTSRALLTLGLGFMPNISGRDNAMYAAMLQGATLKKAKTILNDIADFSELGEFFDQPVNTYSSGMMSRLGFATALYTDVDILLIDEVLSVGDAHFRDKAEAAMQEKLHNQTCVFVSHNSAQINKVCSRAIWIDEGIIKDQGDTKSVVHQYNLSLQENPKKA
jgi:lipopolysaccharide transport system ATP-binding protein